MGMTRVRLIGPTSKVAEAVAPSVVAVGPLMLKLLVPKNWSARRPVWIVVVLVVGAKVVKVPPAALKLTVIRLVA